MRIQSGGEISDVLCGLDHHRTWRIEPAVVISRTRYFAHLRGIKQLETLADPFERSRVVAVQPFAALCSRSVDLA
ncbi:hypothetical protein APX70_200457 [Pseudomonas syringae pv. maculicola]|uniref:Uncharacterized protein n=1 Tax=Pseudomonas syringae pv. maculicola TaxID=59511 RepID=A0A3M2V2X2_PSEYM|nr:hypothetical protein APX70_200457 [Pseudomonas syringae pv. maculicola]